MKVKRISVLWIVFSLAVLSGCHVVLDPPPLRELPRYDHKSVAESEDFQDRLWYGEYSFESYSSDAIIDCLERSAHFKRMTSEDISAFYSFQHTFDTALQGCEVVGTSKELIDLYFDDRHHVTKSIALDTEDYCCSSEYGFFVYETSSKMLYGLNA